MYVDTRPTGTRSTTPSSLKIPTNIRCLLSQFSDHSAAPSRDVPQVFPVDNLRAVAGRGALLAGQQGTVGQRWVVVTGVVPYKKQLAEYRSKFEGTAYQGDDVPKYKGFLVQRGEVVPGAKGEPNWEQKLIAYPSKQVHEKFATWAANSEEVADRQVIDGALALSLPPLADADWGEDVVSPPQIKVLSPDARAQNPHGPGGNAHPGTGGLGAGSRAHGTAPVGPGDRTTNPRQPGNANVEDPFAGQVEAPKPETTRSKEDEAQVPEFLLLRYFDFDVEPDKQYAYRVFLLLQNPNYGLEANLVGEAYMAREPYLGFKFDTVKKDEKGNITWVDTNDEAPWSKVCVSDRLPGDMRLLGGPVVAAKVSPEKDGQLRIVQEINGELRTLRWLSATGSNKTSSKTGLIIGVVPDLSTEHVILVGLQGGETLSKNKDQSNLVNPGLSLVMDENGKLTMHDEAAEADVWNKAMQKPQPKKQQPGREMQVPPRKTGNTGTTPEPPPINNEDIIRRRRTQPK